MGTVEVGRKILTCRLSLLEFPSSLGGLFVVSFVLELLWFTSSYLCEYNTGVK